MGVIKHAEGSLTSSWLLYAFIKTRRSLSVRSAIILIYETIYFTLKTCECFEAFPELYKQYMNGNF